MKLGLSTAAFFGRLEVEDAAAHIGTLSLDCAEVFLQTPSEYSVEFAYFVCGRLSGVPCTSVHPLGTLFENQLFSASRRQRQDAYDTFCRILDAAAALGAGTYVHHGRYTPQLTALPWDLQRNVDVIGPMCEEAVQRGIAIGWENVYWCQLTTPQRAAEAKAALPQVRFTLDIKQAMRAGCDPIAFVYAMGDQLCNVHICDWKENGELCLPGEGAFDFDALVFALRDIGYAGPVIIEPYLKLIGSDDALGRSIAFMQNKLKE